MNKYYQLVESEDVSELYIFGDIVDEAWCENGNGSHVYLGSYKTENEAFQVYKKFKENLIKQIADEYKPYIPNKLYQAMYRYEIEITD